MLGYCADRRTAVRSTYTCTRMRRPRRASAARLARSMGMVRRDVTRAHQVGCARIAGSSPAGSTKPINTTTQGYRTMAEPVEGIWKCTVLGGEANADDKDIVHCRINVQIDEGPDKGRRVTYDEQVNNKSARYVVMSARAVGWRGQGRLEDTFHSDVDAWIKATGGVSTVEVQHIRRKTGKQAGTFWGKARSVGRRQSLLLSLIHISEP